MCSLLQALPGNLGIEEVTFNDFEMSDEAWSLLFRSLATHPRGIISLSILLGFSSSLTYSAVSITTRMNAILQMLRHNTVIHTIDLSDQLRDEETYQKKSILPRLEMNRSCFEMQRQAVTRSDPCIRPHLLGRALHVVRYNPDLVFRFVLENIPAFVRMEEVEENSAIPLENDPIVTFGERRKTPP
jgi:hypothetical protein